MALGHYYRPVTDGAGNLVTGLTVDVRREVPGTPLGVPYEDRDGATSLGNPFTAADGIIDFYAVGGSYRIRAYKSGYDQTWYHEAIGTAQEADIDTLLLPGYLFDFETATTSPPADGCIRANNADLSLATRLYVSAETIAGVDVSDRTADMVGRRALISSAAAGEQVSWEVTSVTDHTTWIELVLTDHAGASSVPAGRCGFQRESAEGAAGADGVLSAAEVTLTGASETLLASHKGKTIIFNRATAMALAAEPAATIGSLWMVAFNNIGAGSVTFDPDGSELVDGAASIVIGPGETGFITCNGTVFRTMGRSIYRPGGTDVPIVDGGTGASTVDGAFINLLLASYFPNYLSGLGTANNASDATNDIDIAAGAANDSTNARVIKLAAGITKRLDAAWAVGSGNGGLDTGTIANAWYHVWLIMRSDTGVVDVLFSTSATAPTMPANYDFKRRIGAFLRTGGAIKAFTQNGNRFVWKVPTVDVNTTNPGTAAVTATLTLPTGIVVEADVYISLRADASDGPNALLLTALTQTDTTPAAGAGGLCSITTGTINAGSDDFNAAQFSVMTNTSGQVRYRFSKSDAFTIVTIATNGWRDTRGRDG